MWHEIYTAVREFLPYFLLGYLFCWVWQVARRQHALERRERTHQRLLAGLFLAMTERDHLRGTLPATAPRTIAHFIRLGWISAAEVPDPLVAAVAAEIAGPTPPAVSTP